jgi:NifU-like protein involved in Fe-S cluster formation
MEYTDKTMEHFMCPQNVGSMPDADAMGGIRRSFLRGRVNDVHKSR